MKIAIHPIVLHKLKTWQTYAGKNEIAVIGHIVPVGSDIIYLLDVYMAQQEGGITTNSMDTAAVSALLMHLFEKKKLQPGDLRCHIHTHPGFGITPSHTDDDTSYINFNKYDYMLTGIFDGKEKFSFHLNLFKPFNIRIEVDNYIDYSLLFEGDFKEEFDANFTEKKIIKPLYSNMHQDFGIPRGSGMSYRPNVQTNLLDSNINVNRKFESAIIDDDTLVQVTNFIKDFFDNKLLKSRAYCIRSDQWKTQIIQNGNESYYSKHGFTENDLSSYIVHCLETENIFDLIKIIEEDIRYTRLDEEFGLSEMSTLEVKHLADMLERGDPWTATFDFPDSKG
uniref:JAB domain-containing protein n=2 Tax=viral metagenome TaxID=1070528 RepID=A0A6M3K3U8_9ZZZZ